MIHSIQWPKAGDVLGDFILESPREITSMRARYLAIHEPTDKKALITCGTSSLDSKRFLTKASELFVCQFKGAAKIADAECAGDFYWIASEYIECEPLLNTLRRRMAKHGRDDLGLRFQLAVILAWGIGETLERFEKAGFVHGELDPFRTVLGLQGDNFGSLIYETGFHGLMDYDFNRARAHPLFCAPEQLHGHPPSIQTDLYACAMIMRVLMLGSPFSSDPDQLLRQCQEERLTPIKQSWPELQRISDLMDAALEKNPANRPRSWNQFVEELELFLEEIGLTEDEDEDTKSGGPDDLTEAIDDIEPQRSSIPAKSKVTVQAVLAEPASFQKERLRSPEQNAASSRSTKPNSRVGRAGKTQTAYFKAPADCGPFEIVGALHASGELQRYRAIEKNSGKEARLVCMRTPNENGDRLSQWAKRRTGPAIRNLPALLDYGVDEGFYFIAEAINKGAPIAEALAPFGAKREPIFHVMLAGVAKIVATIMNECAKAGLLHGNFNPPMHVWLKLHDADNSTVLSIYEMGMLDAFDVHAQDAARKNPYAAPEVRAGKAWDQRADIFSFGAFLFEHLTGCPPSPIEDDFAHVRLGHPLGDAMISALAADPERRPATWKEFQELVHRAIPPDTWEFLKNSDDKPGSSEDGPSSPSGAGGVPADADAVRNTAEPTARVWIAPELAAVKPDNDCAANEQENDGVSESEKPTIRQPQSARSSEPMPSTLRSRGVQKNRRAAESEKARSNSTTLMRWTPSPIVVYRQSPIMVFTRSPMVVDKRAPFTVYGVQGRLMRLKHIVGLKRLETVFAAFCAVAALVLAIGALLKPRAPAAAHLIEMAFPRLAKVEETPRVEAAKAEPAGAKENAEAAIMPNEKSTGASEPALVRGDSTKATKPKSTDSKPKQSLARKFFDYGEKPGENPVE